MKLTKVQQESLAEAAAPLAEWLRHHVHPHCEAVVDQHNVQLTEDVAKVEIQALVTYAIGVEQGENGVGMIDGPNPDKDVLKRRQGSAGCVLVLLDGKAEPVVIERWTPDRGWVDVDDA